MLGNFACFFHVLQFFQNQLPLIIPDQEGYFVGLDLGPNWSHQKFSLPVQEPDAWRTMAQLEVFFSSDYL